MAKHAKGELVVGFNYDAIDTQVAEDVRTAAGRIREKIKRTFEDIVEVGNDLLSVKETLEHGQFGAWLKAEFGWSERTAQNFMSVAERFKSAKVADLPIQPSAAYFLAAPSVPDEARQLAIEQAQAGEEITFAAAKRIVAEARKRRRPRRQKAVPSDQLSGRLGKVLERYRERWDTKDLAELARQLRAFADSLDGQKPGKKTRKD